ncbi:MAG: hypothetical protein ACNA7W_03405 [Pseudomonadales bacterium]
MNDVQLPGSLSEAIATEPLWLQGWVMLLVLVHVAALAFAMHRERGRWRVRMPPIAIVVSFVAAAVVMNWLFEQVGYVRLLGLGHLLAWTPVYLWILLQRRRFDAHTAYGKYIAAYLVIAGISLVIDAADVLRYLAGDGDLFQRWS